MAHRQSVSIVIPAFNEAAGLSELLPQLTQRYPDHEILVVNDGSIDRTAEVCGENGVRVVSHPCRMGNGAAIKTGARAASGEILLFMDADGQHNPADIPKLLQMLDSGYTMAVGARAHHTQASRTRRLANHAFNKLASLMTGHRILDLTSGFRAVRAREFRNILYLLPNGFSYPTTSTMAFFRSGHPVAYVPIEARQRSGDSKIRLFQDGFRFVLIILKIGALFSPMRFFLPIGAAQFLTGLGYYGYTFLTYHRFTNMSAMLMLAALFTFLIGILSEQISALHYRNSEDRRRITDDRVH
jgi:glycosyltransferase involved in cell wall biosynthesis